MSSKAAATGGGGGAPALRKDPYELLGVSKEPSDQEIKTA